MKQRKWVCYSLCMLFLLILTGCQEAPVQEESRELVLSGFPDYPAETYVVYVAQYSESKEIKHDIFMYAKVNEIFKQNIQVSTQANLVVVFLISNEADKPSYFWMFDAKKISNYKTAYWLDYYEYTQGKLKYGITRSMAQEFTPDVLHEVDFSQKPYYLFTLPDTVSQPAKLDVTMQKGGLLLYYGQELFGLRSLSEISDKKTLQLPVEFVASEQCTKYILACPEHYDEETFGTITLTMDKKIKFSKRIETIFPTANSNLMFGVSFIDKVILPINPVTKSIGSKVDIPVDDYLATVTFSEKDNKIYLPHKNQLTVWDALTGDFDTISYCENGYPTSISIAPNLRRIYILSLCDLYILNQDTYEVIKKEFLSAGEKVYVDETRKKMYISTCNQVEWKIYSINNDNFVLENTYNISASNQILLSPDGNQLLLPSISGNGGAASTVYAFDPLSPINVLGECFVGSGQISICFSPDNSKLFGYGSEEKFPAIYVMDAKSYTRIKKIPVEKGNDVILSPNSDGTILVSTSYDSYLGTSFTFLDDLE